MRKSLATVLLCCVGQAVSTPVAKRQNSHVASYNYINYTQFNGNHGPVDVSVYLNRGGRNATAPYLYGWMHEDISHSGDGGLYGELLVNRAFQGSGATFGSLPGIPYSSVRGSENPMQPFGPVISGWRPVGDVYISLTLLQPLSDALPVALQLDIPVNATGEVGILNEGFWGMDVRPQDYNASVYIKSNTARNNGTLSGVKFSLRSNLSDEIWAETTVSVNNISDFQYQYFESQINNDVSAPSSNNTFAITFDAAEVAGNTYYFGLASLFGETYKNTKIRKDLGQAIEDLGSKFLRFPGGNNLEGYSIDQRWKWNETIGPLINRKGRVGDWGYSNTNGLGLMEYLDYCEAAELQPLLSVYAGFSLDVTGKAGTSFPKDQMSLVLEDILNELEFITGNISTPWGSKRAEYGHPEPYIVDHVEIGNEDWMSSTYPYRFPYLYEGIKQAYPNLTIISSAYNENSDYNISLPAGSMWDTHHYEPPSYFLENFDFYDNWQENSGNENVTIFIGESSVYQYDTPSGYVNFSAPTDLHISYPNLMSAIGEGVYLLGAERNPNVVRFSTYAPSLANLNWENWTPNLISFTADVNQTVKSASYYMEQLFAHYRGAETLPTTTNVGTFNPLWWVATIDTAETQIYLKVINSGNSSTPFTINLDRPFVSVNGTQITAPSLQSYNYINNQTIVTPSSITDLPTAYTNSSQFQWNVPERSINVLQFVLS